MTTPVNSPIFQVLHWLIDTPGLGGIAVSAIVLGAMTTFGIALRWIARGASIDEPAVYAHPTSALHDHK